LKPLFWVVILIAIIPAILKTDFLPEDLATGVCATAGMPTLIVIITLTRMSMRRIRPIHIGRIRHINGQPFVDIVRENKQAGAFDAFVARLLARVKSTTAASASGAPAPRPSAHE
jgi:hypothetical protein